MTQTLVVQVQDVDFGQLLQRATEAADAVGDAQLSATAFRFQIR